MMTLTRNHKLLLAVAAAGLLVAGFWFLLLAPQRKAAADLETQIAAKQRELAQAQQQMAAYEKARASYKANYAKLVSLGKAVPADDDVRSLMVQLDASTKASNVDFQNVEVGGGSSSAAATTTASTTGTTGTTGATGTSAASTGQLAAAPGLVPIGTTGVSALPFSLKFNGSYFNLSNFFSRLERFVAVRNERVRARGRLLRIESFSIAPSGESWPHMSASVGAASYVITPVAPLGGASAATPAAGTPSTPPSGGTAPSTTTATVSGAAR
jgi:Tfp pilus assembly protein PilO